MNRITVENGSEINFYGNIPYGTVFRFSCGYNYFIKTLRGAVSLSSGTTYAAGDNKKIVPLPAGEIITMVVNCDL